MAGDLSTTLIAGVLLITRLPVIRITQMVNEPTNAAKPVKGSPDRLIHERRCAEGASSGGTAGSTVSNPDLTTKSPDSGALFFVIRGGGRVV